MFRVPYMRPSNNNGNGIHCAQRQVGTNVEKKTLQKKEAHFAIKMIRFALFRKLLSFVYNI